MPKTRNQQIIETLQKLNTSIENFKRKMGQNTVITGLSPSEAADLGRRIGKLLGSKANKYLENLLDSSTHANFALGKGKDKIVSISDILTKATGDNPATKSKPKPSPIALELMARRQPEQDTGSLASDQTPIAHELNEEPSVSPQPSPTLSNPAEESQMIVALAREADQNLLELCTRFFPTEAATINTQRALKESRLVSDYVLQGVAAKPKPSSEETTALAAPAPISILSASASFLTALKEAKEEEAFPSPSAPSGSTGSDKKPDEVTTDGGSEVEENESKTSRTASSSSRPSSPGFDEPPNKPLPEMPATAAPSDDESASRTGSLTSTASAPQTVEHELDSPLPGESPAAPASAPPATKPRLEKPTPPPRTPKSFLASYTYFRILPEDTSLEHFIELRDTGNLPPMHQAYPASSST